MVRGLENAGVGVTVGQLMGLPQFSAPKKILGIGLPPKPASDVLQSFSCGRVDVQPEGAAVTRYCYWIVFLMTVVRHTEVVCLAPRLEKSHAHEYQHIYLSEH